MGRESVNSFVFNHIGHFATASHAFAKALILGGVVHRFPTLRFAMLEGGVGWACNLVTDLLGHWDKRNGRAMEAHTRPTNLDKQGLKDLFTRFGGRVYEDKMDELMSCLSLVPPFKSAEEMTEREYREQLDDFAAAHVNSADELRRQFTDHFYFGCEADDPTTAWAFDRHGHHRLNPIFSSDVGHFDVTDMSEVLEEAHELVEHGLITQDDFRQFVFGNAARLHTAMNPDFFKGTVVEETAPAARSRKRHRICKRHAASQLHIAEICAAASRTIFSHASRFCCWRAHCLAGSISAAWARIFLHCSLFASRLTAPWPSRQAPRCV
jgi:hypothetical protein